MIQPAVGEEPPLRGSLEIPPREIFVIHQHDSGLRVVILTIPQLQQWTSPVASVTRGCLPALPSTAAIEGFVMTEGGWIIRGDQALVYGRAQSIGVAGDALDDTEMDRQLLLAVLETSPLTPGESHHDQGRHRPAVGTTSPRLEISDRNVRIKVMSDVFFIMTVRGYAPAILVETQDGFLHHVIVGARSFAVALEDMRTAKGQIVDATLDVRKSGPEKTAQYLVKSVQ